MAAFMLLMAFINFWSVMPRVGWTASLGGLYVLRYVFDLFLDMKPDATFAGFHLIDYFIVISRYIYMGLFISVLFKKISHR